MKHSLDEVEAAMDEILGSTPEVEFTEGNPDDVLAEKVLLTEYQVHDLLQSGYSMAEIESMEGFRVELDDMPHVEMDIQEVGEHPVLNDDEGDDYGVDAGGDEVPIHLMGGRRRRPSARIIQNKLKKAVYDKDGGGSSAANPVALE
ncbi:hypothetical protein LXL04_002484 [Taraxacum kok-saghyz]